SLWWLLVQDLETKLDLTRSRCRRRDQACRRADRCSREHDRVRRPEVRVVEQIVSLRSELQSHALSQGRVLDKRKINGLETRPSQRSAAEVPPSANRRKRKRCRIEPLRLFADNHISSEGRID